jgi:hypothetical protein
MNIVLMIYKFVTGFTFKPCQLEQNYLDEVIFRKEKFLQNKKSKLASSFWSQIWENQEIEEGKSSP